MRVKDPTGPILDSLPSPDHHQHCTSHPPPKPLLGIFRQTPIKDFGNWASHDRAPVPNEEVIVQLMGLLNTLVEVYISQPKRMEALKAQGKERVARLNDEESQTDHSD